VHVLIIQKCLPEITLPAFSTRFGAQQSHEFDIYISTNGPNFGWHVIGLVELKCADGGNLLKMGARFSVPGIKYQIVLAMYS
jgi:hypothetical protein